ncbi:MAG: hypothetical protein FJ106_06270 [Deltaproteobacteria bacterium]|nr:hypothetical protein [Deltaproteobacteria bacterium]
MVKRKHGVSREIFAENWNNTCREGKPCGSGLKHKKCCGNR